MLQTQQTGPEYRELSKSEAQKRRIVFTKVTKDSDIEFGILSERTRAVTPLEPFSRAKRNLDTKKSLLNAFSPKHALLYKEDGIALLGSNFNKTVRDHSCHSLEEIRNDINDFCREKTTIPRIPKRKAAAKGPTHRRKSCVCTWCGGVSALEKSIQNHPGIPATICRNHVEERKPTSAGAGVDPSEMTRKSSWMSKVTTPVKYKKAKQTSLVFDSTTQKYNGRSSQRTKTTLYGFGKSPVKFESLKTFNRQQSLPKAAKTFAQIEDVDSGSERSDRSINLGEESPSPSSPASKATLTMLNSRRPPTLLHLKRAPSGRDFSEANEISAIGISYKESGKTAKPTMTEIKESTRVPTHDTSKDQTESPVKVEGNVFKIKKVKSKKSKPQKIQTNTVQKLRDLYSSSACISPKAEKLFFKTHSPLVHSPGMSFRTKNNSPVGLGLELQKIITAPARRLSNSDLIRKPDSPQIQGRTILQQKLGFLKPKKIPEKQKPVTAQQLNLSIQIIKESYRSPTIKALTSPKSKSISKKEWVSSVISPMNKDFLNSKIEL